MIAWTVLCLVVLYKLERMDSPTTFFYDEWAFVFDRRSGGLDSLLTPHNGHLSLLPAVAYRIGFELFGLNHYRPYRIGGLLVHIAVGTLVYRYARARLGAVAGLSLGLVVLLLGAGWQNIFWPFQIGFMGSVAAGISAWMLLERQTRRADVSASVLLAAALACSGLGIAILIGSAGWLAVTRSWRRLASIIGPPAALYAVWYLAYGESQGSSDNLKLIPRYVVDSAAWSVAGLGGRDLLWGRLFLGILLGFSMVFVIRARSLSSTVAAPAVCAVSNWTLIGYSRAELGGADASRYAYVGGVLIILVAVNLLRPFEGRLHRLAIPPIALLLTWGNWHILRAGAGGVRYSTHITRIELRALEWASATVDPGYRPDDVYMPQVYAGKYLAAVADLGSPAASDGEVEVAEESVRERADRVSLEALRFALIDSTPPTGARVDDHVGDGSIVDVVGGTCERISAVPGVGSVVQLVVRAGQAVTIVGGTGIADVRLKRYGDQYPQTANGSIAVDQTVSLVVPTDSAPRQEWSIELRSGGNLEVCRPQT